MTVPVFVNDRRVSAAATDTVLDLLAREDASWPEAISAGRALVTDGRGLPLDPAAAVSAGMIVRAVRSARRD
ncbi:MAG: hypothetical protein FJ206_16215 [Gemmatimonadetes bacterium]|nr:hypothetical protein [Gemmatimonadota bacterium]